MDETKTTEVTQENTDGQQESGRTFTQDELNAEIGKRLAREKAKYADYEELKEKAKQFDEIQEANKSELEKAKEKADKLQADLDKVTKANKIRDIREKVAKETGVPASLLFGEDEESCKAQAKQLIAYKQADTYPQVPNAGNAKPAGKKKPEDAFAEWISASLK